MDGYAYTTPQRIGPHRQHHPEAPAAGGRQRGAHRGDRAGYVLCLCVLGIMHCWAGVWLGGFGWYLIKWMPLFDCASELIPPLSPQYTHTHTQTPETAISKSVEGRVEEKLKYGRVNFSISRLFVAASLSCFLGARPIVFMLRPLDGLPTKLWSFTLRQIRGRVHPERHGPPGGGPRDEHPSEGIIAGCMYVVARVGADLCGGMGSGVRGCARGC